MENKTLTIEQRANRAMNRRNKKIAAAYPLFAEQFATTVDEQMTRLEKQDADNIVYFEHLRQSSIEAWNKSLEYKEQARAMLSQEEFTQYELRYERIYGTRGEYAKPEHVGYFAADWWHCIIRRHAHDVQK